MRRLSPLALTTLPLVGCFGVFNPTLDDDVGESPDTSSDESSESGTSETADTETSNTATSDTVDTTDTTDTTETTDTTDTTETGDPMCAPDQAPVGNGCMELAFTITSGSTPTDLVLAELTGDNVLDLLVANDGALVHFHLGPGFENVEAINNAAARGLALGDIDGSDPPDWAAVGPGDVAMVRSLGGSMFSIMTALPSGPGWDAGFGHINGDDDEDLIVSATGVPGVQVWTADMDTYTQAPALFANAPQGIALGDFDGDGHLDVAVADTGASRVRLYPNDGTGVFGTALEVAVPTVYDVVAADLEGDGRAEVMAVDSTMGNVVVIDVNMDFNTVQQIPIKVGSVPRRIALGDVDGDDRLDVVTANRMSGDASILLNDGNGGFDEEIRLPSGPETALAEAVVLGDIIVDGRDEILIGGQSTGEIAVFAYAP